MPHTLKLHPDSTCASVIRIDASVSRQATLLTVRYVLHGNIASLAIPPGAAPQRVDGLWQHTCFEVFIRAADAEYFEFNLSPSTQWAAYRFEAWREGRADAEIAAPVVTVTTSADRFELQTVIDCTPLAELRTRAWRVALSAVIEERLGSSTSYWALAHPPGKADFHHTDGFAIELAD